MGAQVGCCAESEAQNEGNDEQNSESTPAFDEPIALPIMGRITSSFEDGVLKGMTIPGGKGEPEKEPSAPPRETFKVSLKRKTGGPLGFTVDYVAERQVLPITSVSGGAAQAWNKSHPRAQHLQKGDSILDVNGVSGSVEKMLNKCKNDLVLDMTIAKQLNYKQLVRDLEELVKTKSCGPILIRLSWHDAGVFVRGEWNKGCPNAAMRFTGSGEGAFAENAGLPTVALALLAPISSKYCPELISHADLWALAANVAIRVMGGPDVPTHFGREDALSPKESVESPNGLLPDAATGTVAHLRSIFHRKGFNDKEIVALSGAHTVGSCHMERSGFDGAWTDDPLKFDNSYFIDLLNNNYQAETTSKGCLQYRCKASGTIMLPTDLVLVQTPFLKKYVELYAEKRLAFFEDFADAWNRLQECGCTKLRDIL